VVVPGVADGWLGIRAGPRDNGAVLGRAQPDLKTRLRVFIDAGLLPTLPTPWQIQQGVFEMTPYVLSTDATAEEGYDGAPLGHPILRQPLLLSQIGLDHFGTGTALGARLASICAHLQLTYHRGMPVFDLQVVQTHPDGLAHLRRSIEEVLHRSTPLGRRRRWLAGLILGHPGEYLQSFLGENGWIDRAERLDYATPRDEGSNFPAEFFSLVGFLDYCARTFPDREDLAAWRVPRHLLRLLGRRAREGRRMGWLG
jgi:hypothetical protein